MVGVAEKGQESMAKLIAHWVIADRLYCADDKIRPVSGVGGDVIAQCPVCFGQAARIRERSWKIRTEPLSDYIDRLFKEK